MIKQIELIFCVEVCFICFQSGFTALHLATQNGHNESCRILLYGGVHADIQNNVCHLHIAFYP